jgi:hypothetical protein
VAEQDTTAGSVLLSMTISWLALLTAAGWQVTAVWRAAGRRIVESNRIGKYALWAGVAKLAMVLWSLQLAYLGFTLGVPQVSELIGITFLRDPGMPDYAIRVMANETEVEISGGLKDGLSKEFSDLLLKLPHIRVVHLNSPGGRLGEAKRLSTIIRERGVITYTSSRCVSACTIPFAAGRERWLHRNATLGFHGPGFAGSGMPDFGVLMESLYGAAGIDPEFIEQAVATPHDQIWTPSPEELLRANVITAISDGANFTAGTAGDAKR